ncbi:dihydrodipicolinate synthase family protein [Paracoccus sp. S-4012]|uniref:dihydrodipicolinate synthase family protein n=1 Tax=Paracoccus sp. S-4012 TaxID=2665648 RepID=UPI0012B027DD|nr:dihydrodipicolinate synthase family protein [Paracoccus sp. S-4012]MRX48933.1 dihydrodipicolinate synthase family protein [Paracoccus sp. S-4012]
MTAPELRGVLTPVVTPFDAGLRPDLRLLEQHCRWLLEQGSGLAVFGTNSEGNSLSVPEKSDILDHLVGAGIPAARMMPGTGACALPDAVELSRKAARLGCGGVLLLPPFYYKGVEDEGIFRFVAELIERVGDARLRVYLYHIPPVAQVGFSLPLIERLVARYPGQVVGIKDSSGDFGYTKQIMEMLPGWGVFCGNEINLREAMSLGAAGCISATCNINAGQIAKLAEGWQDEGAEVLQGQVNAVRATVSKFPMIAALKAVAGRFHGAPEWDQPRPPLLPLTEGQKADLFGQLDGLDYSMRR